MAIVWHKNEQALEQAAAMVAAVLEKQSVPTLLLLSGGSWFSLYERVTIPRDCGFLTLGVLDERFSHDPQINNFAQLMETELYKRVLHSGGQMIDTRVLTDESHETHAKRFEEALRVWRAAHPDGVIVATIGVGSDAHVAGIMPNLNRPELDVQFGVKDTWVITHEVGEFARTTVTFSFLTTMVQHAIVQLRAPGKCEMAKQIEQPRADINRSHQPMQVLRDMQAVDIFTDCL